MKIRFSVPVPGIIDFRADLPVVPRAGDYVTVGEGDDEIERKVRHVIFYLDNTVERKRKADGKMVTVNEPFAYVVLHPEPRDLEVGGGSPT
jgi:hypothetical protein